MKTIRKIKSKVKSSSNEVSNEQTYTTSSSKKIGKDSEFDESKNEPMTPFVSKSSNFTISSTTKLNEKATKIAQSFKPSIPLVEHKEDSIVVNEREEVREKRRGTSFSSTTSSVSSEKLYPGSFVSIPDDISDFFDESKRSSIDGFSLSSSPTASLSSAFIPASASELVNFTRSAFGKSSSSPVEEASSVKHGSSFLKKFPFQRKVHPVKLKQKSQIVKDKPDSINDTKTNDICSNDLSKATKMLEKLVETNTALAMEVQGKDEEIGMLNATIDQVNSTWAAKIDGVMHDLEVAQRRNLVLQKLYKQEAEAAKANAVKPSKRIPVPAQTKQKDSLEQHSPPTSSGHDHSASGDASSYHHSGFTQKARNQKYYDPNRNRKQRGTTRPYAKTDDIKKRLFKSLSSSSCISQLSIDERNSIVEAMECKRINRGMKLMQEGMVGQFFYILAEGECVMYKQKQQLQPETNQPVGRPLRQWELFGDTDVFYNSRRVWSCRCTQPGVVWYINKSNFRSAIAEQDFKQKTFKEILEQLTKPKAFEKLTEAQFRSLASASKVVQFAEGDYIIRQGIRTNCIYVVKEGEVTTTKLVDGAETRQRILSPGQVLGISCQYSPSEFNVVAAGKEVVQCIAIPIKNFELVKDDVITDNGITITTVEASLSNRETVTDGIESVSSGYTASESSGYGSETSKVTRRLNRRTHYAESHEKEYALKMRLVSGKTIHDFDEIGTIGHGAYGKVDLVSLRDEPSKIFAIKKLAKYEVVAAQQQKNVFNEKNLQIAVSKACPFVVSMYSTFKDSRFVYFVLEYCAGGELFALLSHANSFNENMAQFYAGCAIEALAFLHSKHIIFRDLKPENVVFDKDGYCKLTDFGFAKKVSINSSMRTYTFCGTAEYMAPEILLYQAQTFSVDLWALGIFIFEMLTGKAPFKHKNREVLGKLILEGIGQKLETPQNSKRLGTTAKDLVKALCHLRPEDRLGAGKNGLSDVARHSWFHKLNWSALRQSDNIRSVSDLAAEAEISHRSRAVVNTGTVSPIRRTFVPAELFRTLTPPWKPKLSSEQDLHYFSPFSREMHKWNTSEEFSGWDQNF